MDFNIKKMGKTFWIKLVAVIVLGAGVLYFQPEFNETTTDIIVVVILLSLLYTLLDMFGIWGKIFGKK